MLAPTTDRVRDPERLAALRRTALVDASAEAAFDRLARLVTRVLGVPVALVSLVDADRQVLKGCVGLPEPWASRRETPLSHSFCRHVVASGEPLVVADACADAQLHDSPAIGELGVVAYAGIPLVTADGHALGSFCAIDRRPRTWTEGDLETLRDLAAAAVTEIELRVAARAAEEELAARRRTQAALAEREEQLRLAVEAADIGVWELDLATGEMACSARCKANFGLAADAPFPYAALLAAVHPADRPRMEAAVRRAIEEGASYAAEYRVTWPDGSVHWIAASGRVVAGAEGRPVRMAGVTAEVTERKQAEEDRARLAAIVESSEEAIVGRTLDGTITSWNPGAEQLYGYAAEEVLGRNIAVLVPPDRADELAELHERLGRGERVAPFETVRVRKDGTRVDVAITLSPIREATGRVVGVSAVARDVTERKRLERLRQDFLAMVTHDLRTPLTTVRAGAQLLKRKGEYRAGTVDGILAQTDRMQRLIDDLADVVRLEAGQLPLRREPVDLAALAREQAALAQGQTERQAVRVEAPPDPVVGCWDRDRLGQVLQNLLGNAIKHAPEGREVVVRAAASGGEAWLSVTDRGPGIAPEHLPRLFERFYRPDASGAGGLGLGLYISRMLIEAHGGRIGAESTPGEGSTFTVTLPVGC